MADTSLLLPSEDSQSALDEVQPVTLAWHSLSVDVPAAVPSSSSSSPALSRRCQLCSRAASAPAQQQRRILSSAQGTLSPGELVAVLGSSGCGKTTLLSCLAGRLRPSEGSVSLNGAPLPSSNSLVAFIQQEDLFLPHLTVSEHLRFQARLRLPLLSRAAAEARAEQLLQRLGLSACAHSLIGSAEGGGLAGRGISGGERKRLSIASALISSPSLILCDEPTSGLDSANAENAISALKELAAAGRSIVATIHSPSSFVFSLFDRVMLLAGQGAPQAAKRCRAAAAGPS